MREPCLAFYGDDFTGSVDALLQYTRAGLRGRLFVGTPEVDVLRRAAADADVIGIAGIARSLPLGAIDEEVRAALATLNGLGARVVQYKACSTADSSPTIGSLGRVLELAREIFGPATVPMLFAQPDFGRYTAFGQHFAAEDGVVYRLDRQPTMSNHPVTPMHESDLALHLSRQTELPIGALHLTQYSDAAAIARALDRTTDAAIVLDAVTDDHVALVGRAVWQLGAARPVFAIGSGGLSTGLGSAISRGAEAGAGAGAGAARARGAETGIRAPGPVLAVSGSRSPQTARQIEHAVTHGWASFDLPLTEPRQADVLEEAVLAELASGRSVVVSSTAADLGGDTGAIERIAGRFAQLVASALAARSTGRVIVCGGDTSSRVLTLLGAESLSIAANPFGNVVVCRVSAPAAWLDGAEMLLKGGQVGPADLFEAIRTLG